MHPFPAGTHVFAEHDVVQGDRTNEEEQLLDGLVDQALLHVMLAHGRVEDAELLNDGGDGVRVRLLTDVDAVGPLPEATWLHAGNPLQALVFQHSRHCRTTRHSCSSSSNATNVSVPLTL